MYRVLVAFADLKDSNHIYNAGDVFPRPGVGVTAERIAELAGNNNRRGRALIVAEAEEKPAKAGKKGARKK